jgi:hypothetical protein
LIPLDWAYVHRSGLPFPPNGKPTPFPTRAGVTGAGFFLRDPALHLTVEWAMATASKPWRKLKWDFDGLPA